MNKKELINQFKSKRVLVTGGAGFIGSNLVRRLLDLGVSVKVLDNLSTGNLDNIKSFIGNSNFEFFEGDIEKEEDCVKACEDVQLISHQAALGSVPRSIEFPHKTHAVNATGFLNMIHAAKVSGIQRFVYASSSSVYGDSTISPKTIGSEGNLLSPYAVTKALNEEYAAVYHRLHDMQTVGLRYFNVFGPNQDPSGVYAAAIPKFIEAMITGGTITIHGDGEQTRDFTYVENAVNANILGLISNSQQAFGKVFNVACGRKFSLNEVVSSIQKELKDLGKYNENCVINHGPERMGDIRHSLADITETQDLLLYSEIEQFESGIKKYLSAMK